MLLIGIMGCGQDDTSREKFEIERVADGDTVLLTNGQKVRYIGIDTPERGKPYYDEATETNRSLAEGKTVRLELDKRETDRYGRTLAYIYVGDTFVNAEIIGKGYARSYSYLPNMKYNDVFAKAERNAKKKGFGIWASESQARKMSIIQINARSKGDDRKNLNGEWIVISNNTGFNVNMTDFTLRDNSDRLYAFGNFILANGSEITIYSGAGDDDPNSLYWKSKAPIWNNSGDTAILKNADGRLIDEYSY